MLAEFLYAFKGPFIRALLLLVAPLLVSCDNSGRSLLTLNGQTMGTTYNVKIVSRAEVDHSQVALQIQVDKVLEEFNQVVSTYINDSELSLINKLVSKDSVVLSETLFNLIEESINVSRDTGGAFDVTVGPLVNLWGFGPEGVERAPTQEEIKKALSSVGYEKLELHKGSYSLSRAPGVYIDLSAIAKGSGVDQVADYLKGLGYSDFLIEIGGEIFASGLNLQSQPWKIGVEKPSLGHSGTVEALPVSNLGVATSGDYRNFYEFEGQVVSHTIDTSTGYPVKHALTSVTVVHETAALADAYATALNVMGPDGLTFAESRGIAAFFIIKTNDGYSYLSTKHFERLNKSS